MSDNNLPIEEPQNITNVTSNVSITISGDELEYHYDSEHLDEADVTYTGLPENVRVRLEEYPIVPMAKEVFRTNNLAMPISLMKECPTLNDLVASTRTL